MMLIVTLCRAQSRQVDDCIILTCEGHRPSCVYNVKFNALVPTVMDLAVINGRFLRSSPINPS